jgi:hypothetical protein
MYFLNILKKTLLLTIAVSSLLFFNGCDCGCVESTNNSTTTTPITTPTPETPIIIPPITAVDGYIKDANLTDNTGQKAEYNSLSGKYIFADPIVYPLHLTGGKLLDTNLSFDINLTAQSGDVISPITTFLGNGSTLLTKLINGGFESFNELKDFEVDYIENNNTNLSKLSQLLYIILKDDNLTNTFKNNLNFNEQNLTNIFIRANKDINSSNYQAKRKMKYLLNKVEEFDGSALDMENFINKYKKFLLSSSNDNKVIILKTGQYHTHNSGNPSGKDDGDLRRGVARNYTTNEDGNITDHARGLIWQDKEWPASGTRKVTGIYKLEEAKEYCRNLNQGNDNHWRLPTIEELFQLTHRGIPSRESRPAIDQIFTNIKKSNYWSSTPDKDNSGNAWVIHFQFGENRSYKVGTGRYFCCVRPID